jgi:hypothetical protein
MIEVMTKSTFFSYPSILSHVLTQFTSSDEDENDDQKKDR